MASNLPSTRSTMTRSPSNSGNGIHEPWTANAPVGYLSRKHLPIKKNDSEPLTREDIQYDLLEEIFSNDQAVFTNPRPNPGDIKPSAMLSFGDLYISALANSPKCSKVLKDKMWETPAFAIELAKLSLLTNIGRINTTMAFFPEMKTALRTYHPVPSLQKTDGNAQDAPRIKNCLKAAFLPSESKTVPPSTPAELKDRLNKDQIPSTSVVNLVFILANHAAPLATVHFHADGSFNFLDLFIPRPISSKDRARAFLWHMHHYLEGTSVPNPFNDEFSSTHPDKAPEIRVLSEEVAATMNIDTPEEKLWGKKMAETRTIFLRKLVSSDIEKQNKHSAMHNTIHQGTSSTSSFQTLAMKPDTSEPSESHRLPPKEEERHRSGTTRRKDTQFMHYIPPVEQGQVENNIVSPPAPQSMSTATSTSSTTPQAHLNTRRMIESSNLPQNQMVTVFSQYEPTSVDTMPPEKPPKPEPAFENLQINKPQPDAISPDPVQAPMKALDTPGSQSMLNHAFTRVVNTDPLQDSDEELVDSTCRVDYGRRLGVIHRLMGSPVQPQ